MFKISYIAAIDDVRFEYLKDSAKNSQGAKIPEKQEDFKGIYKFENLLEANNFGGIAGILGVNISNPNVCSSVIIVRCVRTPQGYECTGTETQCP